MTRGFRWPVISGTSMARDWKTKVLILFGCRSILSFRCLSNDREDTRLAGKGVPCLGYFKVFKTIDDESDDFTTKKDPFLRK